MPATPDGGERRFGEHLAHVGSEQVGHPCPGGLGRVAIGVPRIGREVLRRCELQRIDKEGGGDHVALGGGPGHE